jgi:hypothetical protein
MNFRQRYKKNYFIGWIKGICTGIFLLSTGFLQSACSQGEKQEIYDLGNGFLDHGVAVPIASSRGTVATEDDKGNNIILTWLFDLQDTYSLLMIDTEREKAEQFFLPFTGNSYTSILSSNNRYYTHFKGRFIEFDPSKPGFSFIGKTSSGTAMSMTEDARGVIWAALKPNCSLVSYNPKTGELTDYGSIYPHKARQKPTSIAADDEGWIYVAAGPPGKGQIVAFHPESETTRLMQENSKLSTGNVLVYRDPNGKVYGRLKKVKQGWTRLYQGESKSFEKNKKKRIRRSFFTGNQSLFHDNFQDGKHISKQDSFEGMGFLATRKVIINDPETGQSQEFAFDYKTTGANLMGLTKAGKNYLVGGSNHPMFSFTYNSISGNLKRNHGDKQFNTFGVQDDLIFIGGYPGGFLLKWDLKQEWSSIDNIRKRSNPQFLAKANPHILRPHDLLVYPDKRTVIMAGRPAGRKTGGGLLIWNEEEQKSDLLKHTEVLRSQSTQSLVALPNSKIIGGSTIRPGDAGGVPKAKEAELYIMNLKSRKVEWSEAVIPNVESYQDLCIAPNGLVMGVAERDQFFIFDPEKKKILHRINLDKRFGSKIPYTQGQRSFIKGANDEIYLLLQTGILQVNPDNLKITLLAEAPEIITGGGAYLNGRLYFISGGGAHVYSYDLSAKEES